MSLNNQLGFDIRLEEFCPPGLILMYTHRPIIGRKPLKHYGLIDYEWHEVPEDHVGAAQYATVYVVDDLAIIRLSDRINE